MGPHIGLANQTCWATCNAEQSGTLGHLYGWPFIKFVWFIWIHLSGLHIWRTPRVSDQSEKVGYTYCWSVRQSTTFNADQSYKVGLIKCRPIQAGHIYDRPIQTRSATFTADTSKWALYMTGQIRWATRTSGQSDKVCHMCTAGQSKRRGPASNGDGGPHILLTNQRMLATYTAGQPDKVRF